MNYGPASCVTVTASRQLKRRQTTSAANLWRRFVVWKWSKISLDYENRICVELTLFSEAVFHLYSIETKRFAPSNNRFFFTGHVETI
jgi:hypothetical protein